MASIGAWYILTGSTAAEGYLLVPHVTDGITEPARLMGWTMSALLMVLVASGIGAGKLWAVRLFRWVFYIDLAFSIPILGMGFYLFLAAAPHQRDPLAHGLGGIIFISAVVKAIAVVVIFRALARVRWLDPASLPHEWEPPMVPRGPRT